MKRCPECTRDYYDDTLNFCLEDGTELIYGHGPDTESSTAILSNGPTEAPTRLQTARTGASNSRIDRLSARNKTYLVVLLPVILLLGGYGAYRYFYNPSPGQINSIAVMPFVNESGNPDLEYLSDGITDSVISSLSDWSEISVKARSSVFRYKGKNADAPTLAKELGVQAVINGRVMQKGDNVSLFVELIEAATEKILWSENYNRSMTNLVSLQGDIARDVSAKLRSRFSRAQQLVKTHTTNPEAYRLYLLGRFHWRKRSPENIKKAIGYFDQAISLDPNYAGAYAGLADAYAVYSEYDRPDFRESQAKAREAAEKALKLDEGLAEVHASLGTILMSDYDFRGAEREFKRAIALDPKYATARHWYGRFLSRLGRFEEAIVEQQLAVQLEPVSPVMNSALGNTHCFARRYDECMAQYRKALDLDPNYAGAYANIGLIYLLKKDYGGAVEYFAKASDVGAEHEEAEARRKSFATGGWPGFLRHILEPGVSDSSYNLAWACLGLGDRDKAFKQLNRSFELREPKLTMVKVDPLFDGLRDDPRYFEL